MEAQRLIELFNHEVFGKTDSENNVQEESSSMAHISQNIVEFFKSKAAYILNSDNIRHGVPPMTLKELEETSRVETPRFAVVELILLEKKIGIDKIMEITNRLIPINSEFRTAIIDSFRHYFTFNYRLQTIKQIVRTIRDELSKSSKSKGEIQMVNNGIETAVAQNNVHVVRIEDIEDISKRVNVTVTVFRVAEKDALRAITKLKAEEINRDLSPLLELLA